MSFPKCSRISCRPVHTERPYRNCDRHSIWCATSGCYRNAVGATIDEATEGWAKLVQHTPLKSQQEPPDFEFLQLSFDRMPSGVCALVEDEE